MDEFLDHIFTGTKRHFDTNRSHERYCLRRLDRASPRMRRSDRRKSDSVLEYSTWKERIDSRDNGLTPLMLAARDNKHNIVEKLLELGAVVTDKDKEGRTALHYAAATGSDGIVKLLLGKKVDATHTAGPLDQLPLHMACSRTSGALEIVKTLLKVSGKDSKLSVDKNGSSPLFLAVSVGNQQVVKELLLSQAEQQVHLVKADTGDTVLHAAVKRKEIELAKILTEYNCPIDVQNLEGQTALHIAALDGDEAVVKFLYSVKADANLTDSHDRTPLHLAAQRGNSSIAELLVDKFKANVNLRTKDGSTLMHVAAEAGHPDTAMVFLKKGVPLHMPNKDGAVCLHTAARKGHVGVVKALLSKGATVDTKTKDEYTALHVAVQHAKPQVVQTLLGFGANVQLKGGKEQQTPLHIAARIKDGERVAEMLIKSGANVNTPRNNGETAVHISARHGNLATLRLLIREKADAARRAKNGETPLHHTIKSGRYDELDELVRVLYKTKSKAVARLVINMPTDKGETPLHYTAQLSKTKVSGNVDVRIAKLLLKHGADCTAVTHTTKETPLHNCARSGNNDILVALLASMAQRKIPAAVNKKSSIGLAPLHLASEKGHIDVVRTLLSYQARVDVFDQIGKAALHFAAERGHLEVAQEVLEQKAYVNAKTKIGLTPLHLAAENGHKELVGLLVNRFQGSVDALTLEKKTPLHLAAEKGRINVCQHLLELRADISAVDSRGQTPLHYAAQNDHSEVVALFLKLKPDVMLQHVNSEGSTCVHVAAMKGSVSVMKELIRFNPSGIITTRNRSKYATPLLLAASGGHKEVVEVLIAYGAPASDEDAGGMTVLHLAAKYGHVDVLEVLRGKVPWSMASVKTGLSALHIAARYGQIDVVREMLLKVPGTIRSESPSLNDSEKGDYSYTPLHLAAQSGHVDVVRILLNSPGVRVDSATAIQGSIPLHLAAENGQSEVVSILLSKSTVQLHVKDKLGRSALHLAAANGHRELVSQLIGQGADINAPDENGYAPIHMTADSGHVEVVKLLVESGASPRVENKDGKFPICYAAAAGHLSVVSYLLQQEMNTERLLGDRKFLFDLMVCSMSNDSESLVDFILQTPAPIYSAVKLSRHYRVESTREKERGRDLLAVSNVCENVAVELLSLACADNPEALLQAVDERDIPFLDFLIENEQKNCVSHPTVQVYLGDVWRGDFKWDDWKYFLLFILCLLCPPFWAFLCLPWKDRFHKVPIIKFICHLISHLYLIILFCLTTVVPWNNSVESLIPRWHEWLLLIWLSGLLLSQLTDPHDRAGLGWVPLIVLFLSLIAILLHLTAIGFGEKRRIDIVYSRNQFLAGGMMLCFAQLLDFLSFHHLFGPWGVIIRDLMYDMVRFLVILSIFMMGFTAHLAAVYRPMYGNSTSSSNTLRSPTFGFYYCFEILFFSLFGLTEMSTLVPTGNDYPPATHFLAKASFGIYNVITIIVLINLLIAMMSDTYQRIQRQSDMEWKFGRAKLIRNMKRSTTTPSPLNLLTKLISYFRILYKTKFRCCRADIIDVLRTDDRDISMNTSMSLNALYTENSVSSWVPNGDLRHRESTSRNPRIEDVLDWRLLVKKFIALRGGSTEAVKTNSHPSSRKQPERLQTSFSSRQRRPTTVLGFGRSVSSFGSGMSLHRVVNETVKKLDIVSSMKE